METNTLKEISQRCCPRFGLIAVEFGFISKEQLGEAIICQVQEELQGRGHRLLGQILFEKEWMSAPQIEQVMTELFSRLREEEQQGTT